MSTFIKTRIPTSALILLLMLSPGVAQVPHVINYQGCLLDSQGAPVDGSRLIKFVIYDSIQAGTELWNSEFRLVAIDKGVFNVQLGVSPQDPLPDGLFTSDTNRYLGITVDTDVEMAPRMRFSSNAYAFQALNADRLDGISSESFALSEHDHLEYITLSQAYTEFSPVTHEHSVDDITNEAALASTAMSDPIQISYTSYTQVASIVLSHPTPGYYIIFCEANFRNDADRNYISAQLRGDITTTHWYWDPGVANSHYSMQQTKILTYYFDDTSDRALYLDLYSGSVADVYANQATISAIFIPTTYTSVATPAGAEQGIELNRQIKDTSDRSANMVTSDSMLMRLNRLEEEINDLRSLIKKR